MTVMMSVWVGDLCTGEGPLGSFLSPKSQSFTSVGCGMASLSACVTAPSYPLLRRFWVLHPVFHQGQRATGTQIYVHWWRQSCFRVIQVSVLLVGVWVLLSCFRHWTGWPKSICVLLPKYLEGFLLCIYLLGNSLKSNQRLLLCVT